MEIGSKLEEIHPDDLSEKGWSLLIAIESLSGQPIDEVHVEARSSRRASARRPENDTQARGHDR